MTKEEARNAALEREHRAVSRFLDAVKNAQSTSIEENAQTFLDSLSPLIESHEEARRASK